MDVDLLLVRCEEHHCPGSLRHVTVRADDVTVRAAGLRDVTMMAAAGLRVILHFLYVMWRLWQAGGAQFP